MLYRKLFGDRFFGESISYKVLNHIHPKYIVRKWGNFPLNGQFIRMQQIAKIANSMKPTHVIETGTYFAGSTGYLATLTQGQCITIEANPKFYEIAKQNIDLNFSDGKIETLHGSSDIELPKILQKIPQDSRILAYLDAHWYEDIPIQREIWALQSWGGLWVAVVDDFKVPGDEGYGFDVYGDLVIGPNIIPVEFFRKDMRLFVPKTSSKNETGRKKGTGYIFSFKSMDILQESIFEDLEEVLLC
jgi:cephalosporin hydroxylase